MKKRFIFLVVLSLIISLMGTVAFAKTTSGSTSGGSMGKATGYGDLAVSNSTSAGQDKVTGKTKSSVSESSNWAYATIYYAYSAGNSSSSASGSSRGTTWAVANAKPSNVTGQGYKGVTSHTVNTTNYGGWTGSLSETW